MRSIILAAGFGTRLLPLTEEKPKAIIPILNRPLLAILLDKMKISGFSDIGINIHYLPEMVKNVIDETQIPGMTIDWHHEPVILNTGAGLAGFREFIGDQQDFIVYNCDILTDIDLSAAFSHHKNTGALATLVLIDNPPKNSVLIDSALNILDIGAIRGVRAGKDDRFLYGGGIFIYNRKIFRHLPAPENPYPLIPRIIKLIEDNPGSIKAYVPPSPLYWRDMGSLSAYFEIHRELLTDRDLNFDFLMSENRDGCGIVGKNCRISPSAVLSGFYCIGDNVEVGDGAFLENCIVWENSRIEPGAVLENAVITSSNTVPIQKAI